MIPSRILQKVARQSVVQANCYSVQNIKLPKQHEWNKAVASAEKLVGFPTSMFHLQSLMSDDVTGMQEHLRKLFGSDHPVLKAIKRLLIHGGQVTKYTGFCNVID